MRLGGSIEDKLPVRIEGPGDWAVHLDPFQGTGVWSWQDHITGTTLRRAADSVPLGVAHGLRDATAVWETQAVPFYRDLERSARAYAGVIRDEAHVPMLYAGPSSTRLLARYPNIGFIGLPATLRVRGGMSFYGLRAVRSETVPGLARDSRTLRRWVPTEERDINIAIEWSASWDAWDGAPIDRAGRWAMSLRSRDGRVHSIEVTPRRLQRFEVVAGREYRYTVRRVKDGAVIATGTVSRNRHGLLTVRVPVGPAGIRLIMTPA